MGREVQSYPYSLPINPVNKTLFANFLYRMPIDEIQQREQEQPHNIDEVPVQAEVLNRRNVSAGELTVIRAPGQPEQQHDSDDHVQRVHSGHREVEREEDLG